MILTDYLGTLDTNTRDIIAVASSFENKVYNVPEGKWSPLQILEHIYLTDRVVIMMLSRPSEQYHNDKHILGSARLEKVIVTRRDVKVEAPDALQPKGQFENGADFVHAFSEQRKDLSTKLSNGEIAVDNRVHKHLRLGEMTIADWLYFMVHHSQRHLEQIKDILQAEQTVV